jgi:hypothetical protein
MAKYRPQIIEMAALPFSRHFASTSARYGPALRGGVSRPSKKAAMRTGTPAGFAASMSANKCVIDECTPPGETKPSKCSVPPVRFTCVKHCCSAGFCAKTPRLIASSMRVTVCSTTRPAPRFKCPTSLLPCCPFGNPTLSSAARISVYGLLRARSCQCGMSAAAIALPRVSFEQPNPSRMQSTTGGRVVG